MRAGVSVALASVGILAVCLATLWVTFAAGVWLATSRPTPTQVGSALGLALVVAILARAIGLLAADLRDPRTGGQLWARRRA